MGHAGFAATIGREAGGRVSVGATVAPPKGLISISISVQNAINRRFNGILRHYFGASTLNRS